MPAILTHVVIPIAAGFALGSARITKPVVITGIALAMLPDADVIGFRFGIEYADQFGHRGASHAILVAAAIAAFIAAIMRPARTKLVFAFLFISMASHGILDAFTNGGLGPALLWPISDVRYFAPFTPVRVSPIGIDFFSMRGAGVMLSEMRWIWLPAAVLAIMLRLMIPKTKVSL